MAFTNPSPPSPPAPQLSSGLVMARRRTRRRRTMTGEARATEIQQRRLLADLEAREPEDWQCIYNRLLRYRNPIRAGNSLQTFTSRYVRKRPNGHSDIYGNSTVDGDNNVGARAAPQPPPPPPPMNAHNAAAPHPAVPMPAMNVASQIYRRLLEFDLEDEDDIYDFLDSSMH